MVVRDEADGPLAETLRHAARYVDSAVIVDDASTDDTVRVCHDALAGLPHRIVSLPESSFHREHVLRRRQWDETLAAAPDWILSLDADEVFEDDIRRHVRALVDQDDVDAISFRIFDMWDDARYRSDGLWRGHEHHRVLLVRPVPGMDPSFAPADQHAGRFPAAVHGLAQWTCTIRLRHLGWATPDRRARKLERYRRLDPDGAWGSGAQYRSILDPDPRLVHFDG
jgi:glycosyltransferase involved in cell wall biosynthesis